MTCKSCAERRKRLAAAKAKKREQGKQVQAAALGAVLAVSEAVGKVSLFQVRNGRTTELIIQGEETDGNVQDGADRQGDS